MVALQGYGLATRWPIFFICSDHVWNQSYWPQLEEDPSSPFSRWRFSWTRELFVNWLGLNEIKGSLEAEFLILRDCGRSKLHYRVHHVWWLAPKYEGACCTGWRVAPYRRCCWQCSGRCSTASSKRILAGREHHRRRWGRRRRREKDARRRARALRVTEASKPETAVGHKQAKGCTRNSELNLERVGHSGTELVFSLLFCVRLPPPPAQGWSVTRLRRRLAKEVDERVTEYLAIFLAPLACRTQQAWTKALQSSLQGPYTAEIWVVCQPSGDSGTGTH